MIVHMHTLPPDHVGPFEPYEGQPIICKKRKKPEFADWLRSHGATVTLNTQHYLVTLPLGTRRAVIYPEMQETRYYYILPDETTLTEHTMRDRPGALSECNRLH